MADNDSEMLKAAGNAVLEIDVRYRGLNIDDKELLKPSRDKAFSEYSSARLKLLKDGVIATDQDVADMQAIKQDIDEAAETQQLIASAVKISGVLGRLI